MELLPVNANDSRWTEVVTKPWQQSFLLLNKSHSSSHAPHLAKYIMLPCLRYVTYFLNVRLIVFFLSLLTYFFQLCLWQHKRWSYIIFAAQRSRGALVTGSQLFLYSQTCSVSPEVAPLTLPQLLSIASLMMVVWYLLMWQLWSIDQYSRCSYYCSCLSVQLALL